jgi:integrase/recombinase XerD
MHLLQAGVDITVIALWLGHESSDTTHQYVEADLEMKKRILNQIDAPVTPHRCKTQSDPLVDFLNRL